MSSTLTIRKATPADAEILCRAEKETGRTPGLLVSRPHELLVESFERKIDALRVNGVYLVAEQGVAYVADVYMARFRQASPASNASQITLADSR